MFVEIAAIALMAFIATSEGNDVWDGLSAKWAEDPANGFFTLPQNLRVAKREGWTEISGIDGPSNETGLGYYGDPRIVLLFSRCDGEIIGVQVGFLVADIENAGVSINYEDNPAITKKTLNDDEYFTGTAHFRKDKKKGTRRIWFQENGEFREVPTKPDLVTSETSYYLKRCVKWMGLHYYRINSTTDCSSIFPWFLLRVKNNIIGIGFQAIGTSSSGSKRTWFETIPPTQLAYTIPDAPVCVGEGVAAYGVMSFHVWFKEDPVSITCSDECTATISSTNGYRRQGYTSSRQKRALGAGNVCPV